MSASSIQKAQMILVGGTPSTNTITTANLTAAAFQASTNVGEIGVFNKSGVRLTEATAATTQEFVIAVSRGATLPPLVSDVINKDRIREIKATAWATDTEQLDYIGYNGSSQSIDITNAGELFMAQINLIEFLTGTNNMYIKHGVYKSATSDGQAEIALGLAKSVNLNFSREAKNSSGDPKIKAHAICSLALASDFAFDNSGFDMTVVKGSTLILSGAATPTYNTGTALAVGDYLRIGTAAGAVGTVALTSDVYKVVALPTTTSIVVDRPVNVASGTYVDNSGNITVLPAAAAIASNWGVKLVGQPYNFVPAKDKFRKVRWTLALNDGFDSTVVTNSVAPNEGQGNYEQIASLENFLFGYRGEMYRNEQPWLFSNNYAADSAVAGGGYDVITIKFDSGVTNFKEAVSEKQLILAIPATTPNYGVTGASDDFTDVLEVLAFGSATGALAI